MTTTIKRSVSLFVATLIGTVTGGVSPALAQSSTTPASVAPAPASPDVAPAPVQTAQAEDTNQPAPGGEAPAEMKFGHGGTARAPSAAPSPEPAPETPVMVIPRPRTMEEVADRRRRS